MTLLEIASAVLLGLIASGAICLWSAADDHRMEIEQ
jgi:hypothetical protein